MGHPRERPPASYEWRRPAYHSIVQVLHNPLYAGAYAFGRRGERTRIVDGRAVKTTGHSKAISAWNVLIRDHHEGYIDWERFEENQRMLAAVVEAEDGPWYFKITGPADTVGPWKDDVVKMLKTAGGKKE